MLTRSRVVPGFAGALVFWSMTMAGCSVPSAPPAPTAPVAPVVPVAPVATIATAITHTTMPVGAPSTASGPGGKGCMSNTDCGAGEMCTFAPGCGTSGTCGPLRPCTRDLVTYCGCDGQIFRGSGTCPDKPWRSRGGC